MLASARLLEPGWSSEMPSKVRSCFTVRDRRAGVIVPACTQVAHLP